MPPDGVLRVQYVIEQLGVLDNRLLSLGQEHVAILRHSRWGAGNLLPSGDET
jgi:hypothetical protein